MKRKGKIRVIGIAMLAILIITQVCMPVSASNTDELNVSEGAVSLAKEEHINAAPKDDSPAILDSSSVLLPETNTRALASSVDLSTSRYFPPIGNQRNIGNCTSWVSVYYQFGYQVASKYDLDVDSTSNLFSPKWVHNMAKNNTGNNGSSYSNVYKILMGNGAVRYSECTPATSIVTDTSTEYLPWYLDEADMTNALKYRISNYETLSFADTAANTPIAAYNSSNLTNMKTFLSAGNVLTITADMSTWDYKTLSSQSNSSLNGEKVCIKVYDSDDDWQGHALAVVGYNDNITYDLNGNGTIQSFERGAFKIANSWGTSASNHNDGFIWVMYDALNKVSSATNQNVSTRIPAFDNYKYNVMEIKTLSNIMGHKTVATTIDTYAHITDRMIDKAADRIDQRIARDITSVGDDVCTQAAKLEVETAPVVFHPKEGKIRKCGTGGLYQISENLWEGKYSPTNADGKRVRYTVYAKTKEECEIKLQQMIVEKKAEIAAEKARRANC